MTKVSFPKPKRWLDLEISKILYNQFRSSTDLQNIFSYTDKLPPFETRFPDRLESILGSIKYIADVKNQNIIEVASNIFVSINRGHPFQNGNKRLSIFYADVFLIMQGYSLMISAEDMKLFAILTNLDKRSDKEMKKIIYTLFSKNTTKNVNSSN